LFTSVLALVSNHELVWLAQC